MYITVKSTPMKGPSLKRGLSVYTISLTTIIFLTTISFR